MNTLQKKIALTAVALFLTSGCGSEKRQALLNTVGSPQQKPATFIALREDFALANQDQVNLIAPSEYSSAKKYFDEAQALKLKNESPDKINQKLEAARKNIDAAMTFAKNNRASLSPLTEAREITLQSGAADTTNEELRELDNKYVDLISKLQRRDDRRDALDEIPELTHRYQALSIRRATISTKIKSYQQVLALRSWAKPLLKLQDAYSHWLVGREANRDNLQKR